MIFFLWLLGCIGISISAAETTLVGSTHIINQTFDLLTIVGPATLSGVKAKTIKIKGTLTFNEMSIKNELEVVGILVGNKGHVKKTTVLGVADLSDIFTDELTITGNLKVKNSRIGSIKAASQEIILENTIISGDVILSPPSKFMSTVTLQVRNSMIEGSVLCKNGLSLNLIKTDGSAILGSIVHHTSLSNKQSWWEWICGLFKSNK